MLQIRAERTAALLRALGHAKRLRILCRLHAQGEACAGTLSHELGIGPSALSQHLARMREEGLIRQERRARRVFYVVDEQCAPSIAPLLEGICSPLMDEDAPSQVPSGALKAVMGLGKLPSGLGQEASAPEVFAGEDVGTSLRYRPDERASHRLVFALTSAPGKGLGHPGLARVARVQRLYTAAGVPASQLQVSVVVSGAALTSVLDERSPDQEARRHADATLIRQLVRDGVEVVVCAQAMTMNGLGAAALLPGVAMAYSAVTALDHLQQAGYSLLQA
nr:metalloregulator ArsR/SmtB family transcription factor [Oleiagrimonas sp. C23AA]